MADEVVYVVDEIMPRPGEAQALLDDYMARYAPGARARGMTLDRVLVSPPMWLDDQSNTLTISWTVLGAAGWWGMSFLGRADAQVAAWWAEVDARVVSRRRTFHSAASDVEALGRV